jgi:hypothetical protein
MPTLAFVANDGAAAVAADDRDVAEAHVCCRPVRYAIAIVTERPHFRAFRDQPRWDRDARVTTDAGPAGRVHPLGLGLLLDAYSGRDARAAALLGGR